MSRVQVVPSPRCDLGEGPNWNAETGMLTWVDIHAGVLHGRDHTGTRSRDFDAPLSAAVPGSNGMLLVQGSRVSWISGPFAEQPPRQIATIPLGAATRCNDAQLDAWGRLWVGTMALDNPGAAALFYIEPGESSPTLAAEGFTLTNGIGWSPDRDRIYVVDTTSAVVRSAQLDSSGLPGGPFTTFLDLSSEAGIPDGLCVDSAGGIWIAMFGGGQLRRHDPSGALREVLDLPLRYPTSAAFAGAELDELVITTARRTPKVFDPTDTAGHLLAVRPGVRGIP